MKATELYQSSVGTQYWERNRAHVLRDSKVRVQTIRSLFPDRANFPWCEVGAGVRANLYPCDLAIDIDPRVDPDIVADAIDLPLSSASSPVVFCVGLLMHLPDGEWQRALSEMARIATHAVIIGEYFSRTEEDLRWDPHTGRFGNGPLGLVWSRPYAAPPGWHPKDWRSTFPSIFGADVGFQVYLPG